MFMRRFICICGQKLKKVVLCRCYRELFKQMIPHFYQEVFTVDKKEVRVDELLNEYEAQNGEAKPEEKVYVAYKKIADESCEGALCKTCCCVNLCG